MRISTVLEMKKPPRRAAYPMARTPLVGNFSISWKLGNATRFAGLQNILLFIKRIF